VISDLHKTIFIHIPKTGGASVEKILWPDISKRSTKHLWQGLINKYHNKYQTGGLQHLHAEQIRKEIGVCRYKEYFKFTIVRNPWERTISQFFYLKKKDDLLEFIGLKRTNSLKEYLHKIQRKLHVQWESQYNFLFDSDGISRVDYIGRFENLKKDIIVALLEINKQQDVELDLTNFKMPHLNKGYHDHYSAYYDDESKEMVAQIYSQDISVFGYQFETENNKTVKT
jgi:hypothetical protein